ncbi:MAG: LamG domain-containing protein [Myxococcota bacterium]
MGCYESRLGDDDPFREGGTRPDGGGFDSGFVDGGFVDGGFIDGGFVDGSFIDGSLVDGSFIDGSLVDGSLVDGSVSDGGRPDGPIRDGGIDGPSPDATIVSRALRCTSSTQLVVAHEPTLDFIRDWTLEMWVRVRGPGFISIKGDSSNSGRNHFLIQHLMGGVIQAGFSSSTFRGVTGMLPMNRWTHVALVVEEVAAGVNIRLLVDGVRQVSGTASNDQRDALNDSPWRLCAFDGDLDEVRLWTIARSDSAIAASRNRRFTTPQPSMEAYLPLEESGQITIDRTGRGHEGILGILTTVDSVDPTWIDDGPPL